MADNMEQQDTNNVNQEPALETEIHKEEPQALEAATQDEQEALASKKDFEAEVTLLKDQLLRVMAETENVRKRAEKQVEEATKFAITSFARDLINVMENLCRAIDTVNQDDLEANPLLKALFEGIEMTKRELMTVFDRHGIKRIEPAKGDKFDHNIHQAVVHIEEPSVAAGAVVQILQAGYVLKDRLLRPAMVSVAKEQLNNSTAS